MVSQDYEPSKFNSPSFVSSKTLSTASNSELELATTDQGSEIEEIISSRLPFVVRWGTTIFFAILLLLATICWFIQYPDIVATTGKLNSINAPREVITRTGGKLMQIAINENDSVAGGQILGYMESTANPQAVMFINKQIDTMDSLINKNLDERTIRFLPNHSRRSSTASLGELQPAYQAFTEASIQFKNILRQGFFQHKKSMLTTDMRNIQRMHVILINQRSLLLQDLALTNKTFEVNKILAETKVIASLDYRNEKSKLLAKQLTLPQINASIVSNEGLLNAKKEEIADLNNQIDTYKYSFIQALGTIKSQIQAWQAKYLLRAPISGIVTFIGFFQESQEIKVGQALFYVQPKNSSYFIEVIIPQYNFGKVRVGQKADLKFQAYPFEQYGTVTGKIEYISSSPTSSGYLAKLSLPDGLVTNQRKNLRFQQGLVVQADIITENMRLLQRFYYDMFKQLHNN